MSPLPSTDMDGYTELRKQADTALKFCKEDRGVEFKRGDNWDTLKDVITKAVMAMSNLREGGIVVVGVEENDDQWVLSGMQPEQIMTFEPDDMLGWINRFASPSISIDVVTHEDSDNKTYIVIQIYEFDEIPIICKRNRDDGNGRPIFREGEVYIRPVGKPESRIIQNAEEMRELLDLATEKKTRKFMEQCNRSGIPIFGQAASVSDQDRFDEELGEL